MQVWNKENWLTGWITDCVNQFKTSLISGPENRAAQVKIRLPAPHWEQKNNVSTPNKSLCHQHITATKSQK